MTKKVFVSLPMRDRDLDVIHQDMTDILEMVQTNFVEDVELIDTIWPHGPSSGDVHDESVWYLGKSIKALSEADIVVFHPGWRSARGCIIEHMVCAMYNIPYLDISMDYDERGEPINDYTHDWDLAGQINAELSKAVADAEGLSETDILGNDDVEDALGFEHDDVDDLIEDEDPDFFIEINSDDLEDPIEHDDVDDLVDSDPDLNPYATHNRIDGIIFDEYDKDGNLMPGEYDA